VERKEKERRWERREEKQGSKKKHLK